MQKLFVNLHKYDISILYRFHKLEKYSTETKHLGVLYRFINISNI